MTGQAGTRTGTRWVSLFGDDADHCEDAAVLRGWINDYLIRPHADLGRVGPVCPFVKHAIAERTLWTGFVSGGIDLTVQAMSAVVDDALDMYTEIAEPDEPYAMLTVFSQLRSYQRIEAVHAARKSSFVAKGLMLGQFYPGCRQSGLWNKDFHPLDAPLPMLVVRRMLTSDYPFLVGRSEWLFAYFTRFAPQLPPRLRWALAERMGVCGDAVNAISDHRVHGLDDVTHRN